MTFPGESLAAGSRGNVSGAPITGVGDVAYRAGSATFGPSDEAWVDVPLSPLLLAPGDDAVVSWVLEVIGGSGVLDLSEDAGSLGSHTAATGTLVIPSSLTAADVLAGGTARLTIACTSGTVQVQQVKLRVWPVGGVLGGYSAPYTPPATSMAIAMRLVTDNIFSDSSEVLATGSDIDVVFQDTEDVLAGWIGALTVREPPYFSTSTGIGATFTVTANYTPGATPPAYGVGRIGASVAYIERSGDPFTPDPAGTFGVDWIYPPNEVPYDPDGWQFVGGPVWGWYQGVATVTVAAVAGEPPGNFRVGADPVDAVDAPSTLFHDIFLGANVVAAPLAAPSAADTEFDLPAMSDAGMLRLAFWHDGAMPPPYMGATETSTGGGGSVSKATGDANANVFLGRWVDGVFFPVQASYTRTYRYWTLTPATSTKLRQYHRDDGLGVAPRRAYGGASRNRTGRVYGYT